MSLFFSAEKKTGCAFVCVVDVSFQLISNPLQSIEILPWRYSPNRTTRKRRRRPDFLRRSPLFLSPLERKWSSSRQAECSSPSFSLACRLSSLSALGFCSSLMHRGKDMLRKIFLSMFFARLVATTDEEKDLGHLSHSCSGSDV